MLCAVRACRRVHHRQHVELQGAGRRVRARAHERAHAQGLAAAGAGAGLKGAAKWWWSSRAARCCWLLPATQSSCTTSHTHDWCISRACSSTDLSLRPHSTLNTFPTCAQGPLSAKACQEPPLLLASAALLALQAAARAAAVQTFGAPPDAPYVPLAAPATVEAIKALCGTTPLAQVLHHVGSK